MEVFPALVGALWLSLLAGGAGTGLGALPALALRRMSPRMEDTLLGLSAGVMLAATFFSLLLPGLEVARQRTGSQAGAVLVMGAGMLLGAAALALLHRVLPHEHFHKGREGTGGGRLARIWLLVLAIALHNIPEGLAVGVGAAADGAAPGVSGLSIALAIGAQNLPEGLVVAVALVSQGYRRGTAVLVALLTGLVEPLAALPGALALALAQGVLPWGLAGAAGAMLFVVSDEIIPETHRRGFEGQATFALMAGFIGMMALGQALA